MVIISEWWKYEQIFAIVWIFIEILQIFNNEHIF